MQTVTITRLVKEADLRRVHIYRERYSGKLRGGQAVLLLNFQCDKARLIDSCGGVHNYYAPPNQIFDVDEIQRHVAALGLQLRLPPKARTYLAWSGKAA